MKMAAPQNILSCTPSEAAAIAADIGQHVIVLGVVASARDIRAEFGNFLDHDDDIITALAKEGRKIGRAHSELQSLMRISYAVFCLKKKTHVRGNAQVGEARVGQPATNTRRHARERKRTRQHYRMRHTP